MTHYGHGAGSTGSDECSRRPQNCCGHPKCEACDCRCPHCERPGAAARRDCPCGCGSSDGPGCGTGGGGTGGANRPTKTVGTSRGRLPSDQGLTRGDLTASHPPESWAGERKDLYLPYLFLRANAGDTGTRPVVGPFWESPDVLIAAGVAPADAPPVPLALGQVAVADAPNTVYAHVWNFGQSAAPQTVVEFYWCDPSLGIGPQSAHLIGQSVIPLGSRSSGRSHAVVKCQQPWIPTMLNGGHECLLVRAWDYTSDALGTPAWDASLNRHLGQRNIHVVPALKAKGSGAGGPSTLPLSAPLLLNVGPLYGAPARVSVERVAPSSMPWLQLTTGRGNFPTQAPPTGTVAISPAGTVGGGIPVSTPDTTQVVTEDHQQIAFTTTDGHPEHGQAHVYRVSAHQGGQLFGGYTVILLG